MFINNFDPVAIQFFSIEIRWYSLSYIVGILLGWVLGKKIFITNPNLKENFELHSLDKWANQNLPPHHVPKYWQLVDKFPRTPSQRIRKDLLDVSLTKAETFHVLNE